MGNGISMCNIMELEFNSRIDDEFTTTLRANVPGISGEVLQFEKECSTPYDDNIILKIHGTAKLSSVESSIVQGAIDIDLSKYYGFDYSVLNGILTIVLYKEKKKDISQLKFGGQIINKYPVLPTVWI